LGPKKKEKKKENLFVCLSIYPQLGANNNNLKKKPFCWFANNLSTTWATWHS
jgi:hypothetical protein